MTDETGLSADVEPKMRIRLDDVAAQLRDQLQDLEVDDTALPYDENFADSGQVAAEQGENLALSAQLQDQLDEVESALTKLDDGTYGVCEVCGKPIAEARLEAIPAARFCIDHAG